MFKDLIDFFQAGIGNGFMRHILTMFNLAVMLMGLVFLASLRLRERPDGPKKLSLRGVAAATIFYVLLVWLYFVSQSAAAARDDFLMFLVDLFDGLFGVKSIPDTPVAHFSGVNLTARALFLYIYVFLIRYVLKSGQDLEHRFRRFLEERLNAIGSSEAPSPDAPEGGAKDGSKDSSKGGAEDDTEGGDKGGSSGGGKKKAVRSGDPLIVFIIKTLAAISTVAIVPGGVVTYVFGSEDAQRSIKDVLDWVWSLLTTTTLAGKINLDEGGVNVFLSNFLYVILSVCILAVYITLVLGIIVLIVVAWENRRSIKKWIVDHGKAILIGFAVLVLIVLACTVIFATGSGFEQLRGFIRDIFSERGPGNIAAVVGKFLLLILSLCAAALLLGFFIVFTIFVAMFGYYAVRDGIHSLAESKKLKNHTVALAVFVLGTGAIVGLGYAYDAIKDGLGSIFSQDSSPTVLWVIGHVIIFLGVALGALLALSFVLGIARQIIVGLKDFLTGQGSRTFRELLDRTVRRIVEVLELIPFVLRHLTQAARSLISTVLRIFIGYGTQSQKNRAIFTAACFASLASLLNTFFGLYDFYRADNTAIPVICSLAIACAVQLAMLIFGMKAGEGLAERMIAGSAYGSRGVARVIVSKIIICVVYVLTLLASAACLILRINKGLTLTTATVLAGAAALILLALVVRAIVLQVIDICAIIRARKKSGKDRAAEGNGDSSAISPVLSRPRRLSSALYLTAYLLLMIVSTGFAFNNLFGFYAQMAHIHQGVYDQVRNEADQVLEISDRVVGAVERYNENNEKIINELNSRFNEVTTQKNTVLTTLDNAIRKETDEQKRLTIENARGRFVGDTDDFNSFYAALKTYLEMPYDDFGDDVQVKVETYSHYWSTNPQPSYEASCIIVDPDSNNVQIGKLNDHTEMTEVDGVNENGETVKYPLTGRVVDSDSFKQSVAIETRTIRNADKYILIEELLTLFEQIESNVKSYDVDTELGQTTNPVSGTSNGGATTSSGGATTSNGGTTTSSGGATTSSGGTTTSSGGATTSNGGTTTPSSGIDVRELINENAVIDSVRGNLAVLSYGDNSNEKISILDMPRVVNDYLQSQSSGKTPVKTAGGSGNGGSGGEDSWNKVSAFNEMSDYTDRAMEIDALLQPSDHLIASGDGKLGTQIGAALSQIISAMSPDGDSEDKPTLFAVRSFRNYAQGITHSNFQISYDALLRGSLGLNPQRDEINSLYSSTTVAVFILIICALVDMMAFFSGLLLFKNIYLFEHSKRLGEIGYLNLDAGLTELFTLPAGKQECRIIMALMYAILYDPNIFEESGTPPRYEGKVMGELLKSDKFKFAWTSLSGSLKSFGLSKDSADLRLWLSSFAHENNISFDELFEDVKAPDSRP